jgi:hypothetical protein
MVSPAGPDPVPRGRLRPSAAKLEGALGQPLGPEIRGEAPRWEPHPGGGAGILLRSLWTEAGLPDPAHDPASVPSVWTARTRRRTVRFRATLAAAVAATAVTAAALATSSGPPPGFLRLEIRVHGKDLGGRRGHQPLELALLHRARERLELCDQRARPKPCRCILPRHASLLICRFRLAGPGSSDRAAAMGKRPTVTGRDVSGTRSLHKVQVMSQRDRCGRPE